jgi:rod shape-determining protein MreD
MGLLLLVLGAIVAVAVPDAMPARFAIDRHAPDLFVALAAYLALRGTGLHVVKWAILLGLLKDCASLDPLGTHAFVLGTTALLFARSRGESPGVRGVSLALSVFAAAVVSNVLLVLRTIPMHREGSSLRQLADGVPVALWTALFSWPLLSLLDRTGAMNDLTGRRSERAA